jgi:hypothetical protein
VIKYCTLFFFVRAAKRSWAKFGADVVSYISGGLFVLIIFFSYTYIATFILLPRAQEAVNEVLTVEFKQQMSFITSYCCVQLSNNSYFYLCIILNYIINWFQKDVLKFEYKKILGFK